MFGKSNSIQYKSSTEIELIKRSADILGRVHGLLSENIKSGITTKFLDLLAYEFIIKNNALPSFLNYRNFPATLCVSVNDTVVHGIPGNYVLKDGDIVSIDCGVYLNGFHADSAYTYRVGKVSDEKFRLLKNTYNSLFEGIRFAKVGMRVGDISFSIQNYTERLGYSVVRELVGHGVGKNLHEEPEVPNFGKKGKGVKLLNGMVIAIEPMINLGKKEVYMMDDGWTVNTSDSEPSAHFEHTVGIINGLPEILTTFNYICEEQKL